MYNSQCLEFRSTVMNRRRFLKIFGLGLVASVGARAAKARVCVANPAPFAPASLSATVATAQTNITDLQTNVGTRALQTDHAALAARVTAIETANARVTGSATPGTSVTINNQAIERSGRVVTVNMLVTFTAGRPTGSTIATLPVGFRPSQQLNTALLRGNNSSASSIAGILEVNTNGAIIFIGTGSRNSQVHTISFSFVQ